MSKGSKLGEIAKSVPLDSSWYPSVFGDKVKVWYRSHEGFMTYFRGHGEVRKFFRTCHFLDSFLTLSLKCSICKDSMFVLECFEHNITNNIYDQ